MRNWHERLHKTHSYLANFYLRPGGSIRYISQRPER